jgi:hypothetical protein
VVHIIEKTLVGACDTGLSSTLTFSLAFEVPQRLAPNVYQSSFFFRSCQILTSQILISTFRSLTVVNVALDVGKTAGAAIFLS